jgi:hypothetical protein
MNGYQSMPNCIQDLFAGIPSSLLLKVVTYHLEIGMADLNNRALFVVDLCDFMNYSGDRALNTLGRSKDFRDARRKAAEKERKKDWKRPMIVHLDVTLGPGWQHKLDPG